MVVIRQLVRLLCEGGINSTGLRLCVHSLAAPGNLFDKAGGGDEEGALWFAELTRLIDSTLAKV